MKENEKNKDKKKLQEKHNWIERKDLVYCLVIVILLWLLSSDYGERNPIVLDNWNFAATIVSIILAVLAIVYTFAQSASTLNSTRKLEDAVVKVEETSLALENINVGELLYNLEEKINSLETNVDLKIQSRLDSHIEKLAFFFKDNDFTSSFDFNFITTEQWTDYLTECIKENPAPIGLLLVHLHFKMKLQLDYNLMDVAYFVTQDPSRSRYISGVLTGNIDMLKSFNIVSFENKDKIVIEYMLPNLKNALSTFIENHDDNSLSSINHTKEFIKQF